MKQAETLPLTLNSWVEEAVAGIKPLKIEDDCRVELQKKVRLIYEKYRIETGNTLLAEQRTLKNMGTAEAMRQKILKEIAEDKKKSDRNLWRLSFIIGVAFLIISIICWTGIAAIQIINPSLLWESYSRAAPQSMLVSACLTMAVACWCFYFAHHLKLSED